MQNGPQRSPEPQQPAGAERGPSVIKKSSAHIDLSDLMAALGAPSDDERSRRMAELGFGPQRPAVAVPPPEVGIDVPQVRVLTPAPAIRVDAPEPPPIPPRSVEEKQSERRPRARRFTTALRALASRIGGFLRDEERRRRMGRAARVVGVAVVVVALAVGAWKLRKTAVSGAERVTSASTRMLTAARERAASAGKGIASAVSSVGSVLLPSSDAERAAPAPKPPQSPATHQKKRPSNRTKRARPATPPGETVAKVPGAETPKEPHTGDAVSAPGAGAPRARRAGGAIDSWTPARWGMHSDEALAAAGRQPGTARTRREGGLTAAAAGFVTIGSQRYAVSFVFDAADALTAMEVRPVSQPSAPVARFEEIAAWISERHGPPVERGTAPGEDGIRRARWQAGTTVIELVDWNRQEDAKVLALDLRSGRITPYDTGAVLLSYRAATE